MGLPNAGKSTLYNALLKKQVAFAANYHFALIEELLEALTIRDGSFTAYRLSPYYENDPLALFTSGNQLTRRGKLFANALIK